MRHFYRSHLQPTAALAAADQFFPALGLQAGASSARSRMYAGPLGAMKLAAHSEGGNYTFIEVETNQVGESRLDRNVKKFFVTLHRGAEPQHQPEASY
ncbi:MAG TPA: hypothetical protein VFK16_09050 [Gemmatimonadaceae bacterium]|jgi:hypothetical protein|nr:hypothetical protein [Gemmatimonadaceae bacterium]